MFRTMLCLISALPLFAAPLPVRGLHMPAPKPADVPLMVRFITEALPKEGVNTLVLEVNYQYKYERRPEVRDSDALSRDEVKQLLAASRRAGVRLIPMINCLGHQSWAKTTFALLRSHPEFDETPGKYANNEGIYCRSYCPQHPSVHEVLFDLMDELGDAFEADAFHIGMDEVFLLGETDCPRCKGMLKSGLFADEVRRLHDHLARNKRATWMWADRFLDGAATGLGEWEASFNGTHPAIEQVPRDVVMCDWHYDTAAPTAALFALKGFPVVSAPWRDPKVALGQLELVRSVRAHAGDPVAPRMQGVLQTTWVGAGDFLRAYFGETQGARENKAASESAQCFRTLFAELRKDAQ
ncbi:MAG TPA: family 20 glycosylhydrolase [Bryobacteraceae bacterium]|nr:family 20 glycosylhydrolase [Bryobacteraceae bacterium]